LSDETNITQFPGAKATDTLVPAVVRVTIGSEAEGTIEQFVIATFCLSKTIRTFSLMTELSQAVGLSGAIGAVTGSDASAEGGVLPGLLSKALAVLPSALAEGQPVLYQLLGLLVTSNAKLRRMDEDGEDIDTILTKLGRNIAYNGTNDQVVELLIKSFQALGVDSIVKNLPGLMRLIGGRS
jgi:hypothetical protein